MSPLQAIRVWCPPGAGHILCIYFNLLHACNEKATMSWFWLWFGKCFIQKQYDFIFFLPSRKWFVFESDFGVRINLWLSVLPILRALCLCPLCWPTTDFTWGIFISVIQTYSFTSNKLDELYADSERRLGTIKVHCQGKKGTRNYVLFELWVGFELCCQIRVLQIAQRSQIELDGKRILKEAIERKVQRFFTKCDLFIWCRHLKYCMHHASQFHNPIHWTEILCWPFER